MRKRGECVSQKLDRIELFDRKSTLLFILMLVGITFFSLGYEYYQYRAFTYFKDPLVRASVIDQEVRFAGHHPKTFLKLQLDHGALCRCTLSPYLRDMRGREVLVELQVKNVTFWDYLKGFHAHATLYALYPSLSLKEKGYRWIASQHDHPWMQQLYGALFVATPMSHDLQALVGAMGLSAILSISGYHFGILSLIAYFLLRFPYRWLHNRYFPYRHGNRDLFGIVLGLLFGYLWVLECIPPMVRSFGMIVVGYWLYDRGMKMVSFQTLGVTLGLLLAFFPRLWFSWGFWFSSLGVLSIFVFVRHYGHWKPWQIFLALNVWCYLALLPLSLALFKTFSWWHSGSIPLSLLFNLYYPLVLLLHGVTPWGAMFDPYLKALLSSAVIHTIVMPFWVALLSVFFTLLAIQWRWALWLAGMIGGLTLVDAMYQIA